MDPQEERKRLSHLYAGMSDGELQKVGANPSALTEAAFDVLAREMAQRGLVWPGQGLSFASVNAKAEVEPEDPGNMPVVLRRYRDMPAAFVERSVLEDAGIECRLQDDNVVRLDWLWSNAMGGIKLVVRQKDAEDAAKLLDQRPAEQGSSDRESQP
ncbi:MAG TPA: hypothetical protein VF758_00080 [Candidatus Acidoferrum sp.]